MKVVVLIVVAFILLSGCIEENPQVAKQRVLDFAETNADFSGFKQKYPFSEVLVQRIERESSGLFQDPVVLERAEEECGKTFTANSYWRVKATELEREIELLINEFGNQVECVMAKDYCVSDSECDDKIPCTLDFCSVISKHGVISKKCEKISITECENDDSCCPEGCDYLNDSDCSKVNPESVIDPPQGSQVPPEVPAQGIRPWLEECYAKTDTALENMKNAIDAVINQKTPQSIDFYLSGCFEEGKESVGTMVYASEKIPNYCGSQADTYLVIEYKKYEEDFSVPEKIVKKCLNITGAVFATDNYAGNRCLLISGYALPNSSSSFPAVIEEGRYVMINKTAETDSMPFICAYKKVDEEAPQNPAPQLPVDETPKCDIENTDGICPKCAPEDDADCCLAVNRCWITPDQGKSNCFENNELNPYNQSQLCDTSKDSRGWSEAPTIDLSISNVTFTPEELIPGEDVRVTVHYQNTGDAPAGEFQIHSVSSMCGRPDPVTVGSAAGGVSGFIDYGTINCPWYDPDLWLIIRVDYYNEVPEHDETNNSRSVKIPMKVPTTNAKIYEGESITGIAGTGQYEGQNLEIKLQSTRQLTFTGYEGTFTLHDQNGYMVDIVPAESNDFLNRMFLGSQGGLVIKDIVQVKPILDEPGLQGVYATIFVWE